ncbi:hypothetical protein [Streptomyces zagrosensis]|uniref:Uncharacterized protein n=1 Tax=Streptomyces zagrosensis TaxID=1042984 RepID=A0A7W9Q409_9ACTN|nr:hypothetical protein [Streptomyces zagrosensis]MBB5933218.1 hypothetical protein [Streptomyces zagrosensis]
MGKPPATLDDPGDPRATDVGGGPVRGDLAIDEALGRMGVILQRGAGSVTLRALTGGARWDTAPANLRPLTSRERLSARIAVVNGRWGK